MKKTETIAFEILEIFKYESEEYHCLHMWLDDQKVPTFDPENGEPYSTVGRVMQLVKIAEDRAKFQLN